MLKDVRKLLDSLINNKLLDDNTEYDFSEKEWKILIGIINSHISKSEYVGALSLLHTYMQKYLKSIYSKKGIDCKKKSLQSIFGEYTKILIKKKLIESQATEAILKANNSIISSFNEIRNNESPVHDNKFLNELESKYVVNSILNILEFLRSIHPE